jgi:hypothetical protein
MSDNVVKVTIGKEVIEIDLDEEATIGDIDKDMDQVAAQMAYYGELLGAAKRESAELDAAYRAFRATIVNAMLTKDKGIAEWKVKAAIESQDKFLTFKKAQAACEYNVEVLGNLLKALSEKSPNLRSKGARLRDEANCTGMSTPSQSRKDLSAERREQVRGRE